MDIEYGIRDAQGLIVHEPKTCGVWAWRGKRVRVLPKSSRRLELGDGIFIRVSETAKRLVTPQVKVNIRAAINTQRAEAEKQGQSLAVDGVSILLEDYFYPQIVAALHEAGYKTIDSLRGVNPTKIKGVGKATAQKIEELVSLYASKDE